MELDAVEALIGPTEALAVDVYVVEVVVELVVELVLVVLVLVEVEVEVVLVVVEVVLVVVLVADTAVKVTIVPSQLSPAASTVSISKEDRTQNWRPERVSAPDESINQTESVGSVVKTSRNAASASETGLDPRNSAP